MPTGKPKRSRQPKAAGGSQSTTSSDTGIDEGCIPIHDSLSGLASAIAFLGTDEEANQGHLDTLLKPLAAGLKKYADAPTAAEGAIPDDWMSIAPPHPQALPVKGREPEAFLWPEASKAVRIDNQRFMPVLRPVDALNAIVQFRVDSSVLMYCFGILVGTMRQWSTRWVNCVINAGRLPLPRFEAVDFAVYRKVRWLMAKELAKLIGYTNRQSVYNDVHKAGRTSKAIGGPEEGRILYPGRSIDGVICRKRGRRGYHFHRPFRLIVGGQRGFSSTP